MTTHEHFLNSASKTPSQKQEVFSSKEINSLKKEKNVLKLGSTLRSKLLMTFLPTALVPLAIASVIGINVTQNRAEKEELSKIEQIAISTRESAHQFFEDALNITGELEANPLVIQAIESSATQVQSQGLLNQDMEQIEKQFASTKLLSPNQALNKYLQAMTKTEDIAEIILTEQNGFNVAYSSPTSDFVQSDEQWWQMGFKEGKKVLQPTFDDSTNTYVVETVGPLTNSQGKVFGVAKVSVSSAGFDKFITSSVGIRLVDSEIVQILDGQSGAVLDSLTAKNSTDSREIIGGQPIIEAAKIFTQAKLTGNTEDVIAQLQEISGISQIDLTKSDLQEDEDIEILKFESQERYFKLTNIPNTNFVAVTSLEKAQIAKAANDLIVVFALTAAVLAIVVVGVVLLLARNLAQPLTNLADKAQQVAKGDLEVQASLEGTEETRTLADNFNNLVKRVKVLIEEQKEVFDQQRQEKENLEKGIYQLIEELQGAVDGDLTVRSSLTSQEMSTVADLFNGIIDNLRDIAIQVKESSTQVSSSLGENEKSIQLLAEQAIKEAEQTRKTLASVEEMSNSIKEVAANASQAATLADGAYLVTQEGTSVIDETVNSILSVRTTVDDTGKKMKHLEKSSQKISQVVSLIEEIALKTNLLAINAGRSAGQGQGFTVFGEQLSALAQQSVTATNEIAQIVASIQLETKQVAEALKLGNSQVVDSTRLVESTKQCLEQVLERSQNINELMQSISQATISQTDTSGLVTQLMQQIAQYSEQRLTSSQQVAQSMQATAKVAKQLESAVEQFKVGED